MKKLISIILSAAVISGFAAVPVFADYTEVSYDIERFNYTYDDGTATNDIDGTAALAITDEQRPVELSDGSIFSNEFFLTFDFRFNTVTAEDGTTSVPGRISIDKKKSSGAMDKQGPLLWYKEGTLVTQTGSSSTQALGEISADTWYTAEMEGKMVAAGGSTTFRLYQYVDGEKTLVKETANMNTRQFYNGASNGVPNCIRVSNAELDNVRFVSEYPDEIAISATADEMDAGTTVALDYIANRLGVEVTKHAVVWSVWNEADEEITDESITISTDGVLKADISAESQVVTVKATTEVGAETLTGEYQITVNAVNTANEKYDTIVLDGPAEMKAGEDATFTFTATKSGEDVTDTVTEEDVVWSIYNCDDLEPNNNNKISIENGVLSVDDSVLPQDIYVRATSPSGAVYGSIAIKINLADSQVETVLGYSACETTSETAEKVESVDGSTAYLTTSATTFGVGNQAGYAVIDLDIKFNQEGAGVRIKRNDGKENSSFVYRTDGTISQQTGGSSYKSLVSNITTDKWYHMEILYSSANASCNIYEYGDDGSLTLIKTAYDLNRRNGAQFGKLEVQAGTYVDNIKIVTPIANKVEVIAPNQYIFTGETAQYTAEASRNGLPLNDYDGITWTVLDADQLPIIDDSITINETGLLTVSSMASPQTVTVVAESANGAMDTAEMTIQTAEVFTVTNLGINEEGTKIVKIYVEKNFMYDDDVTFIVAIKGDDGTLKAVNLVNSFGDRYSLGENAITIDFDIPADFNAETDVVETMVWTSL